MSIPPWAAISLTVICLLVHFFVYVPEHKRVFDRQVELKTRLFEALDWDVDQGLISHEFSIKARNDPSVLDDPEYLSVVSESVKVSYQALAIVKAPLHRDRNNGLGNLGPNLVMSHSVFILILTLIFLPLAGFLFEHVYHHVVAIVIYIGTATAISIMPTDSSVWPPPSMAWSFSLATIVLLTLFVAPTAVLTMNIRGWLIRSFHHQIKIPFVVFAIFFGLLFAFSHSRWTPYLDDFSWSYVWVVPALAVAWLFILLMVPNRERRDASDPETVVDNNLARIEMLFGDEKYSEARDALAGLVDKGPTLDQLLRIGELAWRHNENELSDRCFLTAVRQVMPSKDLARILPVVDEVAFKGRGIPAAALETTIELGIQENQFALVRKLVPVFKDHPNIDDAQIHFLFTKIVNMFLSSKEPDQQYLLQVRGWLEPKEVCADLVDRINEFFSQKSQEDETILNYTSFHQIGAQVNIELLAVTNDHIRLQLEGGSNQDVPWTAIIALYGGHMISASRGYRGSIILRFKRKVFSCNFTSNQILITREDGESLGFEDTWSLIRRYAPEGMPVTRFRDFRDHIDLDAYQRNMDVFLGAGN